MVNLRSGIEQCTEVCKVKGDSWLVLCRRKASFGHDAIKLTNNLS